MSYSFNVRAASKAAALVAVAAELDKVEASQPIHAHDRKQADAAAAAYIDLLPEPIEGQELSVSVNGYVSYMQGEPVIFTGACVGVNAAIVTKTDA